LPRAPTAVVEAEVEVEVEAAEMQCRVRKKSL
jgi:hypothetical protein